MIAVPPITLWFGCVKAPEETGLQLTARAANTTPASPRCLLCRPLSWKAVVIGTVQGWLMQGEFTQPWKAVISGTAQGGIVFLAWAHLPKCSLIVGSL